jgi:hypothetical protein
VDGVPKQKAPSCFRRRRTERVPRNRAISKFDPPQKETKKNMKTNILTDIIAIAGVISFAGTLRASAVAETKPQARYTTGASREVKKTMITEERKTPTPGKTEKRIAPTLSTVPGPHGDRYIYRW